MFLRENNTIKYKFLLYATVITILICFAGILWFDKPLFLFLRGFNMPALQIIEDISATKVWLWVSAIMAAAVCVKNTLKSNSWNNKKTNRFNLKEKIQGFFVKSKTNYWFMIFCSVFSVSILADILKYAIGRGRPVFFEALGQTVFLPFSHEWVFNSMPSGHASASFAGFVMIGLLFPKFKWVTWTLAIIIGLSRIAIGDHFPSDVILGAFIGMAVADFIKHIFFRKIK